MLEIVAPGLSGGVPVMQLVEQGAMMEDNDLLMLAAKAAGLDDGWQHIFQDWDGPTGDNWDWNPLTDDGDALRLAVRLSIEVQPYLLSGITCAGHVLRPHQRIEELHAGDSMAATRRAIVRAAAAMATARDA